jgi:glycosyltransferase involved in cell wall biosynthesis
MLLFITRKYPPSVGGMQRLSYHVTTGVAEREPAVIISWGGSQKWLPLFIPYAAVKALWLCLTQSVDLIHLGDLLLAPIGLFLQAFTRLPVIANAHGLDVIYPNRLYQVLILPCARRMDFVICISEHTRGQCLSRGIARARTAVIPVGIDAHAFRQSIGDAERFAWLARWAIVPDCVQPPHILLTAGRLVPRKGVRWLVAEVLPRLTERRTDWIYLVVGDGPERQAIAEAAARDPRVAQRVHLLGQTSDDDLRTAYAAADLFVMPNVPVPGDSEGFGIVHLEARAAGLPVVAADIDGISESFVTEDGLLVPAGDVVAFVDAIDYLLNKGLSPEERRCRSARIAARYDWSRIIDTYCRIFSEIRARTARRKVSDRHD